VSNRRTELGSNGSMTSYVELWNLTLSWPDQIIVKSYHISKTGRRLRPPSSLEINCPYGFLGNGKPQTGTKRPTRSAPSPCIGGRWCVSLDVTYPPKQLRGLSPAASSSSCHYQDWWRPLPLLWTDTVPTDHKSLWPRAINPSLPWLLIATGVLMSSNRHY
jgi:hypothetical protein